MIFNRLLAWLVALNCFVLATTVDAASTTLHEAIEKGLVEVKVVGRGACSGDSVQVTVQRKTEVEVNVIVEPGTVVNNVSGNAQSMVCQGVKYEKTGAKYTRVDVMVLKDRQPRTFLVEAFCRDFHKPTPTLQNSYQLGGSDASAAQIIRAGKESKTSTKAIQVAVWMQKGVGDGDLKRRFKATDEQLRVARVLVTAIEATDRTNPPARRAASQVEVEIASRIGDFAESFIQQRRDAPFKSGDTVEVTADNVPVRLGFRKTITANEGDTYRVLSSTGNFVFVEVPKDDNGAFQRGRLSPNHVRLKENERRGEGRPILRALGDIISESELEVITMVERGY